MSNHANTKIVSQKEKHAILSLGNEKKKVGFFVDENMGLHSLAEWSG
jgi:hypothetical protein